MGTPVFAVPHPSPHAQQLHGFCCSTVAVEQSGTSTAWVSLFQYFTWKTGGIYIVWNFFTSFLKHKEFSPMFTCSLPRHV